MSLETDGSENVREMVIMKCGFRWQQIFVRVLKGRKILNTKRTPVSEIVGTFHKTCRFNEVKKNNNLNSTVVNY